MEWIYDTKDPLWETLLGVLLIFVVVVAITRVVGLRSFAKFTVYDFAFTVAVGSIISSTLTSGTTIAHGSVAIAGLLVLTSVFSYLQRRFPTVDQLIANQPLLLMDGPKMLRDNMAAARIAESQIIAKLREANVLDFSEIRAVVLESTGDISVLHGKDKVLSDRLLEGVRRKP